MSAPQLADVLALLDLSSIVLLRGVEDAGISVATANSLAITLDLAKAKLGEMLDAGCAP